MATVSHSPADITFDFDFYRFNGRGVRPSLVAAVDQASFMRSRYSIEGALVELASDRAHQWAKDHGFSLNTRKPYPSSQPGKYWLEFRFGGLTL